MTNELQQTRYDRLVRRVGGIIGPGAKVAEALAELFPVIEVERVPMELYALMGTRAAQAGTSAIGTAGNFQRIQLFNPIDSGFLITLTDLSFSSSSIQDFRFGNVAFAEATHVATQRFVDSRFGVVTLPVGQLRRGVAAAVSPPGYDIHSIGNTPRQFHSDIGLAVLSPGTGFVVTNTITGNELTCSFMWRERPAEASELNF